MFMPMKISVCLMKFLTVLLLAGSGCGAAMAGADALRLTLRSGEELFFLFDVAPELGFEGDAVCVSTGNAPHAGFQFDDVEKFDFVDAGQTSVNDVVTAVRWDGAVLRISGLPAGSPVMLFDMSGNRVLSQTCSGTAAVDCSGLAHGVYVVKAGKKSIKLII